MRLKPLAVKALLQKPGKHGLGDNLWLTVTKPGQGLWSSRHTLQGKQIEMGHGSAALVSYGEACARADAARRLVLDGVNPVAARRAERVAATAQRLTVRAAAEAYIEAHRPSWRNAKHAAQWRASLEAHASQPSATRRSARWTRTPCWPSCGRSGPRSPRPRAACGAGSSWSWTTARRGAGATARTRPAGGATSP